jgi:uncharacterized protein with GYD domain
MSTTRAQESRPQNTSKLTDQDVRTMRTRYARGDTLQAIGADYGITRQGVHQLVHGKVATFAHLPVPDYSNRPVRTPLTLTRAQQDRMRGRYAAGETRAALAAEYGLSRRATTAVLAGIKAPARQRQRWTDDVVAEIREKHRRGATNRELAEAFGTREDTISKIVRARGRFAD